MNAEEFTNCIRELTTARQAIVQAKRREYTEGNCDVLNNFKTIAKELHCSPHLVLYTYLRKHIASIGQFCADPNNITSEPIDGRIADAINYLELIHGLNKEQQEVLCTE